MTYWLTPPLRWFEKRQAWQCSSFGIIKVVKKKEALVIFVLAVLATGGSCAVVMPLWVKSEFTCGWPLTISWRMKQFNYYDFEFTGWLPFFIDFLFWFLVLAGGWKMVKWVRKR